MKKTTLCLVLMLATAFAFGQKKKKAADPGTAMPAGSIVEITTDYGKIRIRLYNETPNHRDNFLKLAFEGFYDSTLFHRVIKGFMIQGGDPDSKNAAPGIMLGNGDVGYTIPAEFNDKLIHKKGALCAARTNNPEMASSGCQFYIVQGKTYTDEELNMLESRIGFTFTPEQREIYKTIGGTPFLDRKYTVYGEVIEGMDVVDKIAEVTTGAYDRPATDVRMTVKVISR